MAKSKLDKVVTRLPENGVLKIDPRNVRRHSDLNKARIKQSLEAVGAGRGILADAENIIRAGNGIYEQAKALGFKFKVVDVDDKTILVSRRPDLKGKKAIRAAMLDNLASDSSAYDYDADIFADVINNDALLKAIAEEDEKLQALLGESDGQKDNNDEHAAELVDKADELQKKWKVKLGDLWECGEHRVICGDCINDVIFKSVMMNKAPRIEFSDPPYEFETEGGGILKNAKHIKSIERAGINRFDPSQLSLVAITSIFCCNKSLIKSYIAVAETNRQSWDLCFYKKKNTAPNFGGHLMSDTEYLPIIGRQSPNSGMDKEIYSKAYFGELDENHAVAWQKPLGLVEKFLRLFSHISDVVIDRFLGSGTTLIACENLHRRCRAIEINPAYVAVTLQRWSDLTGGKPKRL